MPRDLDPPRAIVLDGTKACAVLKFAVSRVLHSSALTAAFSRATTISCSVWRLSTWSRELTFKDPRVPAKAASPALSRAASARRKQRSALHVR
jgi:hypothetical protein